MAFSAFINMRISFFFFFIFLFFVIFSQFLWDFFSVSLFFASHSLLWISCMCMCMRSFIYIQYIQYILRWRWSTIVVCNINILEQLAFSLQRWDIWWEEPCGVLNKHNQSTICICMFWNSEWLYFHPILLLFQHFVIHYYCYMLFLYIYVYYYYFCCSLAREEAVCRRCRHRSLCRVVVYMCLYSLSRT